MYTLDAIINELAEELLQIPKAEEFRVKASNLAKSLSIDNLDELKNTLQNLPTASKKYNPIAHGKGGWISACQIAIYELIYNLGEEALPYIREVAWGEYDWPQGNAIELLIRFAANGVQTEAIIEEIKQKFPDIRLEAMLFAIEPLVHDFKTDEKFKPVFSRLMEINKFNAAYELLMSNGGMGAQ